MANAIYPKYKAAILGGGTNVDLLAGDVKALFIDLADHPYDAADEFHADITGAAIVATSGNMTTKTVTSGVFDCDTFSWTTVTGDEGEAIIFYIDTGVSATSRLVCFLDTGQTGLPFTPIGADLDFIPDVAGVFGL